MRVRLTSDLQWLQNFNAFKGYNLDFGFIITTSFNANSFYYYKVCDIVDFELERANISIVLEAGNYIAVPVLTSEQNYSSGYNLLSDKTSYWGAWFALPTEPIIFTVTQQQASNTIEIQPDVGRYEVNPDEGFITDIMFDLYITMSQPEDYTVEVYYKNAFFNGSVKNYTIGTESGHGNGVHSFTCYDQIYYLAGDFDRRLPLVAKITLKDRVIEKTIYIER